MGKSNLEAACKNLPGLESRALAYDECVWQILIASEQELKEVYSADWAFDLPAPLHALLCQSLALISEDQEVKEAAIGIAISYGDPIEERNIKIGVNSY